MQLSDILQLRTLFSKVVDCKYKKASYGTDALNCSIFINTPNIHLGKVMATVINKVFLNLDS